MNKSTALLIGAVATLGACTEEPPPPTVTEFVENPILLEAAMVRCSADRNRTRYDDECINAREAVKRIEAKEESARRVEFEKQSEEKRRALRRTQAAAAAARQRAAEAAQRRREAEYLAQFGVPMPPETGEEADAEATIGNTPVAVLPEPDAATTNIDEPNYESAPQLAPAEAVSDEPESDLGAIRDELKRRGENDDGS